MKIKERDLLLDLNTILTKVPFPHDSMGIKTATVKGFVGYTEDMHALVPMIQQVIMGMVTVDNLRRFPEVKETGECLLGWDYHDPELTIKAIQKWLEIRQTQNWENPDRYALKKIYSEMADANSAEVS